MRTAALILVVLLVVAIVADVDGFFKKSSRRRRRRSPPPKPTPAPCDSCTCCLLGRKRSVELGDDIYPNDASLLEDYYSHYKWLPLWAREAVLKAREKRALDPLVFPGDCSSKEMRNFAGKCGLCVTAGGSHYKVCDGAELVTVIPHTVKPNGTCRSIIKDLNERCT